MHFTLHRPLHSDIFVKHVFFLTVNHRGPLPWRQLHSTGESLNSVAERPLGILSLFTPIYSFEEITLAHAVLDKWSYVKEVAVFLRR